VNEPLHSPARDPLLDGALDWVVRLKSGDATEADLLALQRWREQSVDHEEAFREAVRMWRLLGAAARELTTEAAAADSGSQPRGFAIPRRGAISRRAIVGGAIAASVAGAAIIRPPLGLWPSLSELSADYRTAKGERRKVVLGPEVSLELNTQTSVAVRSMQDVVKLELVSGEASVVARLPPSRPLVVLAASGQVTATQASFDARCIGGAVAVTCLEGSVEIRHKSGSVRIQRGDRISYTETGVSQSTAVDPAQASAWRSGLLVFRNAPLAEVIEEVNRYRPGKIIIANSDLKRRVVDGIFNVERLDILISQIQHLFGARATSLPGGVVVLG